MGMRTVFLFHFRNLVIPSFSTRVWSHYVTNTRRTYTGGGYEQIGHKLKLGQPNSKSTSIELLALQITIIPRYKV